VVATRKLTICAEGLEFDKVLALNESWFAPKWPEPHRILVPKQRPRSGYTSGSAAARNFERAWQNLEQLLCPERLLLQVPLSCPRVVCGVLPSSIIDWVRCKDLGVASAAPRSSAQAAAAVERRGHGDSTSTQ
jgi:hypothetical protein